MAVKGKGSKSKPKTSSRVTQSTPNAVAPTSEKPLSQRSTYNRGDAERATAQLMQGITPAKLSKLSEVPDYLKDSKPSKNIGWRTLGDSWQVQNQLEEYFSIEIAPSIVSMCVYLGISKNTLYNILNGNSYKDLVSVFEIAVDRIESNVVRGMTLGYLHPIGSIFYLKNNHGYSDNKGNEKDSKVSSVQVNIQVNSASDDKGSK